MAVLIRPLQRCRAAEKYTDKKRGQREHVPGITSHRLFAEKKATLLDPGVRAKCTGRQLLTIWFMDLEHLQTKNQEIWGVEAQEGVDAAALG